MPSAGGTLLGCSRRKSSSKGARLFQLSQIRKFELKGISCGRSRLYWTAYASKAPLLSNCGAEHAQSLGGGETGYALSLQVNAPRFFARQRPTSVPLTTQNRVDPVPLSLAASIWWLTSPRSLCSSIKTSKCFMLQRAAMGLHC